MTRTTNDHDVIIIGGGPGGLSAALWCADLGLSAVLLEKGPEFGGQLLRTFNAIKNYLGAEADDGRELRDRFLEQVENAVVTRRMNAEVTRTDLAEKTVVLADGELIRGGSVILATGVRRRKLGIAGEEEFYGKGVLESGEKNKNEVAGKRIVIVGGGDAAVENALILARAAEKVFLILRRNQFSARPEFVRRAESHENIELVSNSRLTAIIGNEKVTGADVQNILSNATLHLEADAVVIRIGVTPSTELFRGQIDLDASGFIVIDRDCKTSLNGIYAIGDAANPHAPTISSSVGMAAMAAKVIGSRH